MYDLENTYHWLSHQNHPFPYTIRMLIANMHAEAEAGNFSQAWKYLQGLKSSREISDQFEQALILMQCALAACKMHHPSQSVQDLNEAIRLLDKESIRDPFSKDARAMADWMLGNLILRSFNTPGNVTKTWERSLQTFEDLGSRLDTFKGQREWYQDRTAEMRQGITEAITWRPGAPFLPRAWLFSGNLDSAEIYDYPPSGGTTTSQAANQLILQPVTERFRLADRTHVLFNLRGARRLIILDSKKEYLVLRVADDSMDKVGLAKGDYVLTRRQAWAENGDMVAVQPDGRAPDHTLRTYLKKKDKQVLQPQSSNSEHAIFEIDPESDDGGFFAFDLGEMDPGSDLTEVNAGGKILPHILGVVLGVFKVAEVAQTPRSIGLTRQDSFSEPTYQGEETLSILPIYAAIRAGKPTPVPERTDSMLESHRFWIDGKSYALKNLRGSRRRANLGSGKSIVLRVNGDSMDQSGIEDGNYVLLRAQDSADNGDIVAAVINGVDELATLKRYEVRGKKVVLKPESANAQYQEHAFDAPSLDDQDDVQPFYIAGIVIAVLKPQA
jgi:SOS-response transcriptional repressor LexA